MRRHIISVGGVTNAIKGRDLLRKMGIRAHIERKTNLNGSVGCGYVIVAVGEKQKIINALINVGIKITDTESMF